MVEWKTSNQPVGYEEALAFMDQRVSDIHNGWAKECIWLLEHPPLYTAGTSANDRDLLTEPQFPVHKVGRGGRHTYHGPGQRVAYVMVDLKKRGAPDIKKYVCDLQNWIIGTMNNFGIESGCQKGRVGVWVDDDKIAAIGVRVRHWITLHGISINVNPDMSHYQPIVPCGIWDAGVTSMKNVLGRDVKMAELDEALKANVPF
jgi:lipoyl(octanoyl) transferase